MRGKVFSGLLIVAMLVGAFVSAAPAVAGPPLPDYKPVDVGPEIREWDATLERIGSVPEGFDSEGAIAAASSTPYFDCVLDAKYWLYLDAYLGFYDFDIFYLVAETSGSELWVQADLSWPAGDPRPTPEVTCEQAAYLLGEFDNTMYPVEADFFGSPDFHDGSLGWLDTAVGLPDGYWDNADGRQVVLVSNVRDDSYYDSTYPNYIAGFYSPSFEGYFDRNIMNIDAFDWANRVGPDGSRPYLYESVFAHEYQHLLHDDYDSDEVNWINEGLSMFAEYLTGYVVNEDNYTTFQELPENSLVVWGDQGGQEIVADYGMVFLYHMYLYEKFGEGFLQAEFHNPDNGITSIESTLDSNRKWRKSSFADTYHDFSVAVLIDSSQDKYRYGFKNLDVGIDIGTPDAPNPDAYDTPGAPPWGADYLYVNGDPRKVTKLIFNGVDYTMSPTAWTSNGDALYSGTGNEVDNWAIFPTAGGGVLSFDTLWDLEDYWDYGFVQVSTDGGQTWTSLADNEGYATYDVDPNAYPTVIENLPGLTSYVTDWVTLTYDLSAYAGQDILVAFRLVTDWATYYTGWFVDNVYVDGTLISDGTDASIFKDISELFPVDNNFTVTFVAQRGSGRRAQYQVKTMRLDAMTEEGKIEIGKLFRWSEEVVMIVTSDAPEDETSYAQYSYELVYRESHGSKKDYRHSHSRPSFGGFSRGGSQGGWPFGR